MSPKFPNDVFSYVLENSAWVGIAIRYEETLFYSRVVAAAAF